MTVKLTSPKGLGDTIYLRAVALHFLDKGERVKVFTHWPDVFSDLPVTLLPLDELDRHPNTLHLSYSTLFPYDGSEFQARCERACIESPVDLTLRWKPKNISLLDSIRRKAGGRKIFIYQPLKVCRTDYMRVTRPHRESYRKVIAEHSDYFRVKIGHPPFVDDDRDLPCELDMLGKGLILDTFDICTAGDLFFGEPCFVTVIAQALDRRVICMVSRRALKRERAWTWNLDWQFHKRHLATVVYDE